MAIPTITQIIPAMGHPGGTAQVEVRGTGFRMPSEALPTTRGTAPAPPPTVRVFFGGAESPRVRLISEERLLVTLPQHAPEVVSVEVYNVGQHGETLGDEWVALEGGFEYRLPPLTERSIISEVTRRLIELLMQQVHPEVVITQSVDFSEDTMEDVLRKVAVASLPCVMLIGPRMRDNPMYRNDAGPQGQRPGGGRNQLRKGRVKDLVFTIGALSDNMDELLTLMQLLDNFVDRNPAVELNGARYELAYEAESGEQTADPAPSESGVKSVTGTIVIRRVRVVGAPGIPGDTQVDVHPQVQSVQLHPTQYPPSEE